MRRALSYAFDYDGFNNDILAARWCATPAPTRTCGARRRTCKGYTYDLDKAKQQLGLVKEKLRPLRSAS